MKIGDKEYSIDPVTFLVWATTVMMVAVIAILTFVPVPVSSEKVLTVLIGSIGSQWTAIVGYYFGSSSGSARKTDMLATPPKKEGV